MVRTLRGFTIRAVILCFMSTQVGAALFAQEQVKVGAPDVDQPPSDVVQLTLPNDFFAADRRVPDDMFAIAPLESSAFAQRGFRGRGRGGRNDSARAAVILGAVATIAGTAVLVYANRPDCSTNPAPGGCGYGAKVVGGAVLSAGVVAMPLER